MRTTIVSILFALVCGGISAHSKVSAQNTTQNTPQNTAQNTRQDPTQDTVQINTHINTVVITGTRTPKLLKDVPVPTRVITAEDIRKSDASDITDVLQTELPAMELSFSMNQQTSLKLQGFGPNRRRRKPLKRAVFAHKGVG